MIPFPERKCSDCLQKVGRETTILNSLRANNMSQQTG